MDQIMIIYACPGKRSEVVKHDLDMYSVNYYIDESLTHSVTSKNVNEAQRLAENYVNSPGQPKFLTEAN
jgi:hypothetical protein